MGLVVRPAALAVDKRVVTPDLVVLVEYVRHLPSWPSGLDFPPVVGLGEYSVRLALLPGLGHTCNLHMPFQAVSCNTSPKGERKRKIRNQIKLDI